MIQRKGRTTRKTDFVVLLLVSLLVSAWQTSDAIGAGTYQAEDIAHELSEDSDVIEVGNAQENLALETTYARFYVSGAHVDMRWRGEGEIIAFEKGTITQELAADNQWRRTRIRSSRWQEGPYSFSIRAAEESVLIDTLDVYGVLPSEARPYPTWVAFCLIPFIGFVILLVRYGIALGRSGKQDAS